MSLTVKQKKFADEYIVSGNAAESARRAGYSKNYVNTNANKLLQNTTIRAYIDERLGKLEKEKIADANEVLGTLTAILRQELTEEVVEISPATGDFIRTTKKPSIAEVTRAGTELLKRYPTNLETEKLKLELEKLRSQLNNYEETQDDKLTQFVKKLDEVINGGI